MTEGIKLILILAPLGMVAWVIQLYLLFWVFGKSTRDVIHDLSLPESVFFGAWGLASAHLVSSLFSRFI